jgi:L-ribulose-5-phosphate 4-epimerase
MIREIEIVSQLRRELADFSRRAFDRGLVGGTGGNVSVRIPGTDRVLITPTGVSLGDVEADINLLVGLDGTIIESPPGQKPSKETAFHLAVYRLRPDAGAIAHLHPPYATAYSNTGQPLPLVTVSSRGVLKEVPCVECATPGSAELCNYVEGGISRNPGIRAMLMKEHGILTLGPDLKTAYYLADLVEDTAKIAYLASHIKAGKGGPS